MLSIDKINNLEKENKKLRKVIEKIKHWLTAYKNENIDCLNCCGHQLITIHLPEILSEIEEDSCQK